MGGNISTFQTKPSTEHFAYLIPVFKDGQPLYEMLLFNFPQGYAIGDVAESLKWWLQTFEAWNWEIHAILLRWPGLSGLSVDETAEVLYNKIGDRWEILSDQRQFLVCCNMHFFHLYSTSPAKDGRRFTIRFCDKKTGVSFNLSNTIELFDAIQGIGELKLEEFLTLGRPDLKEEQEVYTFSYRPLDEYQYMLPDDGSREDLLSELSSPGRSTLSLSPRTEAKKFAELTVERDFVGEESSPLTDEVLRSPAENETKSEQSILINGKTFQAYQEQVSFRLGVREEDTFFMLEYNTQLLMGGVPAVFVAFRKLPQPAPALAAIKKELPRELFDTLTRSQMIDEEIIKVDGIYLPYAQIDQLHNAIVEYLWSGLFKRLVKLPSSSSIKLVSLLTKMREVLPCSNECIRSAIFQWWRDNFQGEAPLLGDTSGVLRLESNVSERGSFDQEGCNTFFGSRKRSEAELVRGYLEETLDFLEQPEKEHTDSCVVS